MCPKSADSVRGERLTFYERMNANSNDGTDGPNIGQNGNFCFVLNASNCGHGASLYNDSIMELWKLIDTNYV